MTQITTDFPIVTRDCATISTNFPSSYCQNPNYAASIRHYYETVLSNKANSTKSCLIGQIGFGNAMEIMLLWQLSQQLKRPVRLSVFDPYSINSIELGQFLAMPQNQATINSQHLAEFSQQLHTACIANIQGCQRLIFDHGQFIVDIYFGDIEHNLKGIQSVEADAVEYWHCLPHTTSTEYIDHHISEKLFWQMGRLSKDNACFYAYPQEIDRVECSAITVLASQSGFIINAQSGNRDDISNTSERSSTPDCDIPAAERKALRYSHQRQYAYCLPSASAQPTNTSTSKESVAIIGGGIAAAHLALSLVEKGKNVTIYCKDSMLADGASGNKQGAIYPLLTPDNNLMSQYFQQAFLFSRRRLKQLENAGYAVEHQFCGVLQTGFDERSDARLTKIIQGQAWPSEVAAQVSPSEANMLAGITIDKPAFYYPWAGWICPHQFAQSAVNYAQAIAKNKGLTVEIRLDTPISELTRQGTLWQLNMTEQTSDLHPKSPPNSNKNSAVQSFLHSEVVVASGAQLTEYQQTKQLQVTGFRGQVSHIPSKGQLTKLNSVICAHGYLTPENNQHHCVGASYVKSPDDLRFCPTEQQENAQKMHHSFPQRDWVSDIDVSDNNARVGVRMVTRDHCPMMGLAPNIDAILNQYNTEPLDQHQLTVASRDFWRHHSAPVYRGLYVLGGLGSRGLSSGPLAAEALAAMICHQTPPISYDMFAMLNPNRMWLRKLLKGKSLLS
ncbi:tRNA 5-methylaminomethyl-2-thiouridine biosynthesis bifunctional protein MnmC [Shewanella japonica]|uniref:tRNA 5-methylaminomethyl-2-thiouridine biosynthesis bifunctional protein MnmC n=1 Tax=Shewanella japonica TaxID=93973 RepID=A0ABM6JLI3_9GAMM|nr:tRNA 5-methylaminomethyl-2-thiouridine biosynthesis bifunctional protein MnmC [Shewanella japonica]